MASSKCIAVLLLAVFMLATVSTAQYYGGCGSSYYPSSYGYGSYYSPYSSYGSYGGYYGKREAGFGAQQAENPRFQHQAKH